MDEHNEIGRTRDALVQSVMARGRTLRRRRYAVLSATALAVTALVAGGIAVAAHDDGGKVRVDSPVSPSSAGPVDSTTSTTTTTPPATDSTTGSVVTQPSGPPGASTTTDDRCHNSYDPACGPFHWAPVPQSTISVVFSPARPVVGDTVTMMVTVDGLTMLGPSGVRCDSNSQFPFAFDDVGCTWTYHYSLCFPPPQDPPRYGLWDPPPASPLHWVWSVRSVVTGPIPPSGNVPWDVGVELDCRADSPYQQIPEASGVLHVDPAPSTSTSTTATTTTTTG